MNWAELTDLSGNTIYVNLAHVVSVETLEAKDVDVLRAIGATLRTSTLDDAGRPLVILVRDAPEVVYAWATPAPAQ